jgi:hypothetical protein
MLSCRFGQLRFRSSKPELRRRPCWRSPRRDLPFHRTKSAMVARATPTVDSNISPRPAPPKWSGNQASGWKTADGGSTQGAHCGTSGSAKGRLKHPPAGVSLRLQSLTPTESPYSRRSPLGMRPSRCSHDLFPLRGIQSNRWACALPSCACSAAGRCARRRLGPWFHGTTGYRSG